MVGIKDIASKANVSISTVSYALNGSPRVSEKTKKRIIGIAKEMNYIPNMAGQNLRRKRTDIIAVYLSTYQGTFYGDLLDGMHNKAKELGLELIVCSGERSRLFLPQRMIDGILVLDLTYPDEELLNYAESNHPIVVLDRKLHHSNIKSVLLDNRNGAQEAMYSFRKLPIDTVYIVSGPEDNFDSTERLEAAVEVADHLGYTYNVIEGEFTEESGFQAAEKINREWSKPIGIFALNDEMGIGLQNYFSQTQLSIGKDLFVRGFDDIEICQYLTPPLKSVSYSKNQWGAIGVETLYKMIQEEEVANTLIPTYFQLEENDLNFRRTIE